MAYIFNFAPKQNSSLAGENIKVYVRVRPPNDREAAQDNGSSSGSTVSVFAPNKVLINGLINGSAKGEMFTYDCVGSAETTQEQVFNAVGKRIVEQCVQGYNGTIFAYGQTGSGKTYTMQGPSNMHNWGTHEKRGIIPRCLEYLFQLTAKEQQMDQAVEYRCKASYIEIYNEAIYDLLDNTTPARILREDINRTLVYVDGIEEVPIHNPQDAYNLYEQGASNRHISATSMNRESSRSHTVFTLTIQSSTLIEGVTQIRESRFNLVDLAGSERQKSAMTEGLRLKEASNINRSLTYLGLVIKALAEIASGKSRFVNYRDSRLTFLLRDSLGGNSNTYMVANISPSTGCYQETVGTLRFAQQAKMIKNKAVVNQESRGNEGALKAENKKLKAENQLIKAENQLLKAESQGRNGFGTPGSRSFGNTAESHGQQQLLLLPTLGSAEDLQQQLLIARRVLAETLARWQTEHNENLKNCRKAFMLDEAYRFREKQIQSQQLILKLRDSSLNHHRKGEHAKAEDEDKSAYIEEISQLRKKLDHQPEIAHLQAENLALRDMLQRYQEFQKGVENAEEQQKQDKEYLNDLATKVLGLQEENEALRLKFDELQQDRRVSSGRDLLDFSRTEGMIDDIMAESPPKSRGSVGTRLSAPGSAVRGEDEQDDDRRRFSSDYKSLYQKVTQQKMEEIRRLSGSFSSHNTGVDSPSILSAGNKATSTTTPTPLSVDGFSPRTMMRNEDTVEMTMLKRDYDAKADEVAALKQDMEEMVKQVEQIYEEAELKKAEYGVLNTALEEKNVELQAKNMKLEGEIQEYLELMKTSNEAAHRSEQEFEVLQRKLDQTKEKLVANEQDQANNVAKLTEMTNVLEQVRQQVQGHEKLETEWKEKHAKAVEAQQKLIQEMESERQEFEAKTLTLTQRLESEKENMTEKVRKCQGQLAALLVCLNSGVTPISTINAADVMSVDQHLDPLEEQISTLQTQLQDRDQAQHIKIEGLEKDCRQVQEQLESYKTRVETDQQKLVDELASVRIAAAEELQVETSRLQYKHENEISAITTQLDTVTKSFETSQQSLDRLNQQLAALDQGKTEIEKQLKNSVDMLDLLTKQHETLEAERQSVEIKYNNTKAKLDQLDLEARKTESTLQQESWNKRRLEDDQVELREKVAELNKKLNETEHRLEKTRDEHFVVDQELRAEKEELEERLAKTLHDLAVKSAENQFNEQYKRKFRELRAQFADLGQLVSANQEQGFHERELERTIELEETKEEMEKLVTRTKQLEAGLELAKETNEQLSAQAQVQADTVRLTEEMKKRVHEMEVQRQTAESAVAEALEQVETKTREVQALEIQMVTMTTRMSDLEEKWLEEQQRCKDLSGALEKGQQELERERVAALEKSYEVGVQNSPNGSCHVENGASLTAAAVATQRQELNREKQEIQEARRRLKEEQAEAHRLMVLKLEQSQEAQNRQQQDEKRSKMAFFAGIATQNEKLLEQVQDLNLVNERIIKHQNPKQKLQYHVKIKQENNELRIENQRLMFRTIELEERLGNKENVESLKRRASEIHGPNYQAEDGSGGGDGSGSGNMYDEYLGPTFRAKVAKRVLSRTSSMASLTGSSSQLPTSQPSSSMAAPAQSTATTMTAAELSSQQTHQQSQESTSSGLFQEDLIVALNDVDDQTVKDEDNDEHEDLRSETGSVVSSASSFAGSRLRNARSMPPVSNGGTVTLTPTRGHTPSSQQGQHHRIRAQQQTAARLAAQQRSHSTPPSTSTSTHGGMDHASAMGPRARAKAAADAAMAAKQSHSRLGGGAPTPTHRSGSGHAPLKTGRIASSSSSSTGMLKSGTKSHSTAALLGPRGQGAVTKPTSSSSSSATLLSMHSNAAIALSSGSGGLSTLSSATSSTPTLAATTSGEGHSTMGLMRAQTEQQREEKEGTPTLDSTMRSGSFSSLVSSTPSFSSVTATAAATASTPVLTNTNANANGQHNNSVLQQRARTPSGNLYPNNHNNNTTNINHPINHHHHPTTPPVIGSASAQRALDRQERLAKALEATKISGGPGSKERNGSTTTAGPRSRPTTPGIGRNATK